MATAAQILEMNRFFRVPARWARYYEQLCAERDRLMARDFSAPAISRAGVADLRETGAGESQRAVSMAAATATQATIFEVLAAIRRMERGVFGICEITGGPIEPSRLKAIPWARYSLRGQKKLEHGGQREPAVGHGIEQRAHR